MALDWLNAASSLLGGGGGGGTSSGASSSGYTGVFQVGKGNNAAQTSVPAGSVVPPQSVYPATPPAQPLPVSAPIDANFVLLGVGGLAVAFLLIYALKD